MRNLLDLVLPTRCAGCGDVGAACCPSCLAAFRRPQPLRRPRLAAQPPLYAMAEYGDVVRSALLAYKERGRTELAGPLGEVFARGVAALPRGPGSGTCWLVPAPSRRAAARARGGQHVLRAARSCAAALARSGTAAGVAPALRLARGARDSVGLSAHERAANVSGRVRVVPAGLPPPGSRVLLLDDLVTTAATVAACAAALAGAGLRPEAILVLAAVP